MITQSEIFRLANSSKEFFVDRKDSHVLVVREYYNTSNQIRIDLSKLTPEMLYELAPDGEEDENEEY